MSKANVKRPKGQGRDSSMIGIGVMINSMFSDRRETLEILERSVNRTISDVRLVNDFYLEITFDDGYKIELYDDGQSCCERRFMHTDDDLSYFSGSVLYDVDLKDGGCIDDKENHWDSHEVQFLEIKTSKGCFTMSSHNIHNGYYGGFWIKAREIK